MFFSFFFLKEGPPDYPGQKSGERDFLQIKNRDPEKPEVPL